MRTTPAKTRRVWSFTRAACLALFIAASLDAQGEIRLSFTGANVGDEYGSAVNTVGDLNHDGIADVIVGAPFDLPGLGHPGSATIYSGKDGSVLFSFQGTAPNQLFGLGVAPAGDVNHDGIPDVIIGLSQNGSTGLGPGGGAKVFSGADGSLLLTFAGSVAGDGFGQTVDTLGDLDGDGYDDVIVGTSFSPSAAQPGYARVYSGATGAVLYTKTGTFNGQRFGLAYAAGDVNGDGVVDFMIGAIGDNVNGTNSGSIFVYSGASGALLFSAHGAAPNNLLGYSGLGVGDLNGDGFGEVIAGTFVPGGVGYARVYSGADGSVLYNLTNGATGDVFGHTVAGVGDVNGDGTKDFVVAAPNSNAGGAASGRITVYSGATGTPLRDFIGSAPGVRLGYSVKGAGDVNGDLIQDIIVGSLITSSSGMPGRAEVVSICAAQAFGTGLSPNETLSLQWILGTPTLACQGGPLISGATPNSAGIVAASLGPGNATYFDVPVLLDVTPGFLTLLDVTYDESGSIAFPVSLRNAYLAGLTIYVQAFEANDNASQGFYASNGMLLLFGL